MDNKTIRPEPIELEDGTYLIYLAQAWLEGTKVKEEITDGLGLFRLEPNGIFTRLDDEVYNGH